MTSFHNTIDKPLSILWTVFWVPASYKLWKVQDPVHVDPKNGRGDKNGIVTPGIVSRMQFVCNDAGCKNACISTKKSEFLYLQKCDTLQSLWGTTKLFRGAYANNKKVTFLETYTFLKFSTNKTGKMRKFFDQVALILLI